MVVNRSFRRDAPPAWLAAGDFVYRDPPVPVMTSASGCVLSDGAGHHYLDAEAANGSVALGYDPTILPQAVSRTADLTAAPSFVETGIRLEVSERIAEMVNERATRAGRVAFELGGAQGIELAMKIVHSTGRRGRILTFEGGYHGRSPYTAQLSASERYRTAGAGLPVQRFPHPDCQQCRFGQVPETCAHECVQFVKRSFTSDLVGLRGAEDIAALVIEPVLNVGGMAAPDDEYLESLVEAARNAGALVIVDEVFTGLYRTGTRWGFEQTPVEPDLIVFSKALTNGITPLSCVWGRAELMNPDTWSPGSHSSTFAGNPLALAVADTVMDRLLDDAWRKPRLEDLNAGLRRIVASLEEEFPELIHSSWTRGGVSRLLLSGAKAAVVRERASTIAADDPIDGFTGVLVASTGMAPNVVSLHPPFTISESELASVGLLLARTLGSVTREQR